MAIVTEIGPDLYRISVYVEKLNLQFNHFLVNDEEPLLFHTGYRRMFPEVREGAAKVLDPARLRWISFSHFEMDECGALNEWLGVAPNAQAACNFLGAALSVDDFAIRPARVLGPDDRLQTGKYSFRYCSTAHLPHGWDAGVLFEETTRTLLCSDLLFHFGQVEPVTESDIVGRSRDSLVQMQSGPLGFSVPYTPQTDRILESLAALEPRTLATMHGSSFRGDGARALRDLAAVLQETMR